MEEDDRQVEGRSRVSHLRARYSEIVTIKVRDPERPSLFRLGQRQARVDGLSTGQAHEGD